MLYISIQIKIVIEYFGGKKGNVLKGQKNPYPYRFNSSNTLEINKNFTVESFENLIP